MALDYREAHHARVFVAITFHYAKHRLRELFQVIKALSGFMTAGLDVIVATNTSDENEIASIQRLCGPLLEFASHSSDCQKSLEIHSFPNLTDPLLLPWAHKPLIVQRFLREPDYTHYIYLEDDIQFSFANLCYFLKYRQSLRRVGLLPSFVRVEYNFSDDELYSSDQTGFIPIDNRAAVRRDGLLFMNIGNPYNAAFVLDRELAEEYAATRSFRLETSETVHQWGPRERAARGLCFENVPAGFNSRFVVPVSPFDLMVPAYAYLYHTANNYANDPGSGFGKILLRRLFASRA